MNPLARNHSFYSMLAIVACLLVSGNGVGQEAPEIEAFISGIDNYDKSEIGRYGSAVEQGEVPQNVLPGGTENDFAATPRTVPSSVESDDTQQVANENVQQKAVSETLECSSGCVGSDYFEMEYAEIDPKVRSTWVLGVNALIFDREFDGDRQFSFDPGDPTMTLSSTDADAGIVGGIDVSLGRRRSNGRGFEARYWGLYPDATTALLGGTPSTSINGLSQINDTGTALSDTFNAADFHELTREYSLNNVELSLLRNGRSLAPWGKGMTMEWLTGFRYIQFDESLEYAGVAPTNPIIRSALNSSVENSMFGAQFGGRAEWQLFKRLSFSAGGKFGFFNNRAQTNIVATNQLADLSFRRPVISTGAATGTQFDFSDTKDDLSMMGEFDLGLILQMTRRSRIRMGYRGMGVSNVVTAENNIPTDFTDTTVLQSANTNGDLILRGAYAGAEFAF